MVSLYPWASQYQGVCLSSFRLAAVCSAVFHYRQQRGELGLASSESWVGRLVAMKPPTSKPTAA